MSRGRKRHSKSSAKSSAKPSSPASPGTRPSARSAWAATRRDGQVVRRPPSTRDVIRLDMEPLLARERQRVERLASDLDGFNRELDRFKSEWEPGFSRWYHSRFGGRITRARELEAKLLEIEDLIHRVETESMLRGCSERAAYRRIERERGEQELGARDAERASEERGSKGEADEADEAEEHA